MKPKRSTNGRINCLKNLVIRCMSSKVKGKIEPIQQRQDFSDIREEIRMKKNEDMITLRLMKVQD